MQQSPGAQRRAHHHDLHPHGAERHPEGSQKPTGFLAMSSRRRRGTSPIPCRDSTRIGGRGWSSDLPVFVRSLHKHEQGDPTRDKKKAGNQSHKHLEQMTENRATITLELLDTRRVGSVELPPPEVEINHRETDRAGYPNRYRNPR